MRALGWALNLIAGLILLYVLNAFLKVENFFGDGLLSAFARKLFWNEVQIYILTAAILIGVGIWALFQEKEALTTQIKPNTSFKGERQLNNDAYKIYLASKYNIQKNETFESYQFNDKLFPKLASALQAAHEYEEVRQSSTKYRATIAKDGNILCGHCGGYNNRNDTSCKFCDTELVL